MSARLFPIQPQNTRARKARVFSHALFLMILLPGSRIPDLFRVSRVPSDSKLFVSRKQTIGNIAISNNLKHEKFYRVQHFLLHSNLVSKNKFVFFFSSRFLLIGKITLGSNRDADILVAGTGVEPVHCAIENNNGVVTLHPINGNTSVDGVPINSPVRLAQGKRPWPKYEWPWLVHRRKKNSKTTQRRFFMGAKVIKMFQYLSLQCIIASQEQKIAWRCSSHQNLFVLSCIQK